MLALAAQNDATLTACFDDLVTAACYPAYACDDATVWFAITGG